MLWSKSVECRSTDFRSNVFRHELFMQNVHVVSEHSCLQLLAINSETVLLSRVCSGVIIST